jgi:hypothetical protein
VTVLGNQRVDFLDSGQSGVQMAVRYRTREAFAGLISITSTSPFLVLARQIMSAVPFPPGKAMIRDGAR